MKNSNLSLKELLQMHYVPVLPKDKDYFRTTSDIIKEFSEKYPNIDFSTTSLKSLGSVLQELFPNVRFAARINDNPKYGYSLKFIENPIETPKLIPPTGYDLSERLGGMSMPVYRIVKNGDFYVLSSIRRVWYAPDTDKPDDVAVQFLIGSFTIEEMREIIWSCVSTLESEAIPYFGETGITEEEAKDRKQRLLASLGGNVKAMQTLTI